MRDCILMMGFLNLTAFLLSFGIAQDAFLDIYYLPLIVLLSSVGGGVALRLGAVRLVR